VKWLKGERELKDSFKYSINRDGSKRSLTVRNLAFEDVNNYSIEIQKEKCTAQLKVKGKWLNLNSIEITYLSFLFKIKMLLCYL
jgi:hypothetical protein